MTKSEMRGVELAAQNLENEAKELRKLAKLDVDIAQVGIVLLRVGEFGVTNAMAIEEVVSSNRLVEMVQSSGCTVLVMDENGIRELPKKVSPNAN